MIDHRDIDERSLAFGAAIAERLRERPELIGQARANVEVTLRTCSPRLRPALIEWMRALDESTEAVVALLTGRDERSTRLRQSNPFTGVLTPSERNAIIRKFERTPRADP
jgi:hypothetical protein